MILFALLWLWLYSPHSVIVRSSSGQAGAAFPARIGAGSALFEAFNVLDLVRGSITAFTGKRWSHNGGTYPEKHVSPESSADRSSVGGDLVFELEKLMCHLEGIPAGYGNSSSA
jgi:hypothetical protein